MSQAQSALRKTALVAACMAAAFIGGCSSQVRVSELDNDLKAGSDVNGLPFRAMRRYKVALYRLAPNGKYEQVQADKGAATLPDPERLYVLQMKGQPLSDDTVTATLNPDSTIKKLVVDVKGKDKDAFDAVTKAIGDVDAAHTAKETAAETSTTTGEAARLAAQKARLDAEAAELELKALPTDATPLAKKLAENKLANLKLEANQKYRKANLSPLPFSDVGT
jgi:hypothetical protein